MSKQKITVLGLGYIGLPMALLLAKAGHEVVGYDVVQTKIDQLTKNQLYFEENGLSELFIEVQKKRTFRPQTTMATAEVYIVAVPTPQDKGTADLRYVIAALEKIKTVFKPGGLIVVESTIGPRDAIDKLLPIISSWNIPYLFSYCPERAIPGSTLDEMVNNDRIIGAEDKLSLSRTKELYSSFVKGKLLTSTTTIAASSKVMENTYRAVNIALANEFALLAENLQFNVWEAIKLANHHPRVKIHQPGPGVGGHCIPIDPWFFVSHSQHPSLIEHALNLNEQMAHHISNQVKKLIEEKQIKNPIIGILGYAYKPNVDDSRETPTEKLISNLKEYTVLVSDPFVSKTQTTTALVDQDTLLSQADLVIIATAHTTYSQVNFALYPKIKILYDAVNILPKQAYSNSQAEYHLLGSQPAPSTN